MLRKIARLNAAKLFAFAVIIYCLLTVLALIVLGNTAIDIQLHDTMFVISQYFIMAAIILFFVTLGSVYYWFPRLTHKKLNRWLGLIHFYITFIGVTFVMLPMYFMTGLPRSYYTYNNFGTFNDFNQLAIIISVAFITVMLAQLLFIFNILYSLIKGKAIEN